MANHPRPDVDGVRVHDNVAVGRLLRLVASAAVLVAVAAVVAIMVIRRAPGAGAPAPSASAGSPEARAPVVGSSTHAAAASAVVMPPARPAPVARRRTPPAAGSAVPPTSMSASEAILGLRAAGERGGIAAFGLPGTDPPRSGIIVPDDFELPPGYLRHFQVTDDGEQLPPILLFHPDYEFVDAQGQPVALPANRIVPPEMAPPGLPIRMLEVPAPGAAGHVP